MKEAFFQVEELHVQTGGFQLRNISFSLQREEYLIILGPTGCGKTMLLETLAGLRSPARGRIVLENNDITAWPPEARGLGFAYQDSLLYPFLTVKENILFGARARKKHKKASTLQRLDNLAEAMGISQLLPRFPRSLSGGEMQRVSLARAILNSPPVLLLDEPLSALDPQTRYAMQELLYKVHSAERLGIIHVTHDFKEALQLGTKVIVMNRGEIVQQGDPLAVFHKPRSLFVAKFLQSENIIEGRIEHSGGVPWFKDLKNGLVLGPLPENSAARGEVHLMVRAGQLKITLPEAASLNKPNAWSVCVEKILVNSTHVEMICNGSGSWRVVLSLLQWQELALRTGARLTLSVDMEHVHLIKNL
ncbi:MAG: ABC transporter ATP-binding protein [Peptococcaceae bacterium]